MTRSQEYRQSEPGMEDMGEEGPCILSQNKPNEQQQHVQEQENRSPPRIRASPLKATPTTPTQSPKRLLPHWQSGHQLSPTAPTTPTKAASASTSVAIAGSPFASPSPAAVPSSPSTSLLFTCLPHEHDPALPPSPTPPRRVSSPGLFISPLDTSMTSPPSATASTRRRSHIVATSMDLGDSGQNLQDHPMLTPGTRMSGSRRLSTPRLVDLPMLSPDSSQLGKHPKTPSPDEPRSRTKGIKTLSGKALDIPLRMPDFTSLDVPESDGGLPLLSPTPRPYLGLPPISSSTNGHPKKGLFSEEISRLTSKGHSIRHATTADDNPFLEPSEKRELFKGDYLTCSQWRSERAHHLTRKYLDIFFRQDRVVMFADEDMEKDSKEDYLESHFRLIRPFLSNGEFSDVIRVEDKATGVASVVKRLKKTVHGAMERKRYLNEVRNFWRVASGPNVIQLRDAWEQHGRIFMRMELCEYGSLHAIMMDHKLQGGFSEETIWRCLSDLARGLKSMHDMKILHLDFKPANAFVDSRGVIKIGDFGHSCELPVLDTDGKEGDRCYMAQELLQGRCDYYSDIFSLGATIFEMTCNRIGDLPGEGPEWHRIRDGHLDFDLLLSSSWDPHALPVALPIISPPPEPTLSQEKAASATPASATPASAPVTASDSAPSTPSASSSSSPPRKASLKFSQALLDVISDMMQPAFEFRPLSSTLVSHPRLMQVSARMDANSSSNSGAEGALASLLKPSYSIC